MNTKWCDYSIKSHITTNKTMPHEYTTIVFYHFDWMLFLSANECVLVSLSLRVCMCRYRTWIGAYARAVHVDRSFLFRSTLHIFPIARQTKPIKIYESDDATVADCWKRMRRCIQQTTDWKCRKATMPKWNKANASRERIINICISPKGRSRAAE